MMRKKPMLAYPVSAKPIDYSKPTFIQPKLDGVRCVIQNEKREGYEVVTAYSRTGKETWISIFEVAEDSYCEHCYQYTGRKGEDKCIFVGMPTELINKYKLNTNDDG